MKNEPREPLDHLLASVERAWVDRRDAGVAQRLATRHPEHAEDLHAFFAALVADAGSDDLPPELVRGATEGLRAWLAANGLASGSRPFVAYLLTRTGESPAAIAERIGNATWDFLVQVSRYPSLVPDGVRRELAARIEKAWQVPPIQVLDRLAVSGSTPRAASRREPLPPPPASFDELLERTSLRRAQRAFWKARGAAVTPS